MNEAWKERIRRQLAALDALPIEEKLAQTEALLEAAWERNEELEYAANPDGVNPDYLKLAELAKATVLKVMLANEAKHPDAEWKRQGFDTHMEYAEDHIADAWIFAERLVDRDRWLERMEKALTRAAMALAVLEDSEETR